MIRLARPFWIGAAAILVAAALVALVAVLRGDFSDTDGRILGTLAAALVAGSTVVAGLALVERPVGRRLGRLAVAVSVPAFGFLVYAIWSFVFDGGEENAWRWGWSGALVLVAALLAVTGQLIARTQSVTRLARVAGTLAAGATAASIGAIWADDPGDAIGRTIAVLWIVAGLAYLLVPVTQRFTAAGVPETAERLLAELDEVELVATRAHEGALDIRLEPGERLLLRRRS